MAYHERQRKSPPKYKSALPDINVEDPHLQDVLEKFKQHLLEREGEGTQGDNAFVKIDDLERMGVIKRENGVVKGGGANGQFTSADGKTVTVRDGLVTNIQ